jgi:hypothetical protein
LFLDPGDAASYTEHLLLVAGGGDGLLRTLLQHQEHWRQHLRLQLCVRLRRDRRLRPHYSRSKECVQLEELKHFYRRCQDLIMGYRRRFGLGSEQASVMVSNRGPELAMTTAIYWSPFVHTMVVERIKKLTTVPLQRQLRGLAS